MAGRGEDYWTRKYRHAKALVQEKRASIRRLEIEVEALEERRLRIGKKWVQSRKG